LGPFWPRHKLCIHFCKKWIGLHFGWFFSQTRLVTLTVHMYVTHALRSDLAFAWSSIFGSEFFLVLLLSLPTKVSPCVHKALVN
jgi:hypothetical protein